MPVKKKIAKKKKIIKRIKHASVESITMPTDYSLKKTGISQSMLGAFQCCPQRFLFMVNRWKRMEGDRVFEFGNIYHEMLDQAYSKGKVPSNKILSNRINKYAKHREPELSATALDEFNRQLDLAEMILQEYFKFYSDDFKDIHFLEMEEVFEVSFMGNTLRGKKDGKFNYVKKPDVKWMMEHKTKGRVDTDILESVLNFDLQNHFYMLADDIQYNHGTKNVLYNIIRNPGLKQTKKETWKEYVQRIRKDIQSRPEFYFIRYECPYTSKNKKRFENELFEKFKCLQLFINGKIGFYRNELACKSPYRCEYLDACASGNMVGYIQGDSLFPEL